MALFGTTYHGDYSQLLHNHPIVNSIGFHEISDDTFEAAFCERALGECATASALQVRSACLPHPTATMPRQRMRQEGHFQVHWPRHGYPDIDAEHASRQGVQV